MGRLEFVLLVFSVALVGLLGSSIHKCTRMEKCEKLCDPQVGILIEHECHCKDTKGWQLKTDNKR